MDVPLFFLKKILIFHGFSRGFLDFPWFFPLSRGLRLGGRHVRHAAAPDVAPGEQLGGRGALDALQITWLSMVKTYDKFTIWDYGIYIVYSL